jgi:hypothetical protein
MQFSTDAPSGAKAFDKTVDEAAIKKILANIADLKREKRDAEGPLDDLRRREHASREKVTAAERQKVSHLVSRRHDVVLIYVLERGGS